MKKTVLLLIFLFSVSVFSAEINLKTKSDVEIHESFIAKRLKNSISVFVSNSDQLIIKVSVKKNLQKEKTKLDGFEYLPLSITDAPSKTDFFFSSYQVNIISLIPVKQEDRIKILKVLRMEFGDTPYEIDFEYLQKSHTFFNLKQFKDFVLHENFWKLFLVLSVFFVSMITFIKLQSYHRKMSKSQLLAIHDSQVFELVSYVKDQIREDSEIIEKVMSGKSEDILGVKALLVYLLSEASPQELLSKSSLQRILKESNSYDDKQFGIWLRQFCERIATVTIKYGAKNIQSKDEFCDNNVVNSIKWTKDNLHLLPSVYISDKLNEKTVNGLSNIIKSLPGRAKLHFLSNLDKNVSESVLLSSENDLFVDHDALSEFIVEIQNDYDDHKFFVREKNEKKPA